MWIEAGSGIHELKWRREIARDVALAMLLGMPLLTIDARLRRGASRVVEVIGPTELPR
jgi:hypothetical protein